MRSRSIFFMGLEVKRLQAELVTARSRLLLAGAQAREPGAWREEATRLLDRAEQALGEGLLDLGWRCMHEADRVLVQSFGRAELEAQMTSLRSEAAHELPGWRGEVVQGLARGAEHDDTLETLQVRLARAMLLRDVFRDYQYFQTQLLRRQIGILCVMLLLLSGLLLGAARRGMLESGAQVGSEALPVAMLLGGIGAVLSALLTFASSSPSRRVPEALLNSVSTFARPLLGAVSGVVGWLALNSGVFNVPSDASVWLVVFAFGFSERLVLGTLERVGKAQGA